MGDSSPYVSLGWEIVKPAGAGPSDWLAAIASAAAAEDISDDDGSGQRLDAGTIRSSLQTGPQNLLILPPSIASVVYVLDCSSSMDGAKFRRVSLAIIDAVAQMQPRQKFSLILFNQSALQIRGGGYRSAGPPGASKLAADLNQIGPSGGTDPTDALVLGIQLKPQALVFLSDGDFEAMTVDRITHLNWTAGKNTQINCIAINAQVANLKRLAALNGPGNYVEVP